MDQQGVIHQIERTAPWRQPASEVCCAAGSDFLIAERSPTGQDIAMEAGTLRIQVEKAKVNWGTYFQDMFRPKFGGGFQNYSGRGPSVVAHNFNGEKRVLEVTKTVKDAQNRATAIEQDFETLNTAQWCERYDVPLVFVSG